MRYVIICLILTFAVPVQANVGAPIEEPDLVLSWFDCVVAGNKESAPRAAILTGLSEREVLELAFVVRITRPLSSWRFKHGELLKIEKFPDRYELTYSLPDVTKKSAFSEWKSFENEIKKPRKYVNETRTLKRSGDGKIDKAGVIALRSLALSELEKALKEYQKSGMKIEQVESVKASVRMDKNLANDLRKIFMEVEK